MPPLAIVEGLVFVGEGLAWLGEAATEAYETYRIARAAQLAKKLADVAKAANTLHQAEQAAQKLKEQAQDKACADCGEVGCFNTPGGGDDKEMDRQLKEQEDAINGNSPDDILNRMKDFEANGRPNDSAARTAARNAARQAESNKAFKQALADGKSWDEAEAAGETAGNQAVSGMDATHEVDWVAGGDGAISGIGNSKINRSIGSQWNQKAPGSSTTRREDLKNAAEAAKKAGKKKMNVKLKRC